MADYDEVVVHVETLEEYRAVLDEWFDKGCEWSYGSSTSYSYHEEYFKGGGRYLILDDGLISYSAGRYVWVENLKVTPFKEFMDNEQSKVTYDVSEDQMAFINRANDGAYPATYLVAHDKEYKSMFSGVGCGSIFEHDLLRYLGGDDSVVFKLKEPQWWRLVGKDAYGGTVYFTVGGVGAPTYTHDKSEAFVASHEEITSWKTPFWEIESVEE